MIATATAFLAQGYPEEALAEAPHHAMLSWSDQRPR
jgi:hypothetical protein